MIRAAGLIAEREFRTYTRGWTFWLALLLGPILVTVALLVSGGPPAAKPFRVQASDPAFAADARAAVRHALVVEGRRPGGESADAPTLRIQGGPAGAVELAFDADFPLSAAGRELVREWLETGPPHQAPRIRVAPAPPADLGQVARTGVMIMLWMTLIGSLGMLLQAVVRERSNRSLETLMAAAGPLPIVVGKVAGVGLVSLLVLGAWLAAAAAGALLAPSGAEGLSALLHALGDPRLLLRAGVIYLLTYAFYGLATVALGALARDTAAAQNLARPMFLLLMAAFFVAMSGGPAAPWQIFFPPFAPFVLLVKPAGPVAEGAALALLMVSIGGAGAVAVILLRRVLAGRPARRAPSP